MTPAAVVQAWNDHYQPLADQIRPGNEPTLRLQNQDASQAIVLIHGLTDSPHYVTAAGDYFYRQGFHVLMPLLPGHGLKQPKKMQGVTPEQWIQEVNFAVAQAQALSAKVSIGGFSTGGTLSVYKAITDPTSIQGGIFLFAAALGIVGFPQNLDPTQQSAEVMGFLAQFKALDAYSLIGANPYKYAHVNFHAASVLARLLIAMKTHYQGKTEYADIQQPVFVAHSEFDATADIQNLDRLVANHPGGSGQTEMFRIAESYQVHHVSLMLAEDIYGVGSDGQLERSQPLETKNPFFEDMMERALRFAEQHL